MVAGWGSTVPGLYCVPALQPSQAAATLRTYVEPVSCLSVAGHHGCRLGLHRAWAVLRASTATKPSCCDTQNLCCTCFVSVCCRAPWLPAGTPTGMGCNTWIAGTGASLPHYTDLLAVFVSLQGTMVAGWDPTGPLLYYVDSVGQHYS
jgi:hypothetical protein